MIIVYGSLRDQPKGWNRADVIGGATGRVDATLWPHALEHIPTYPTLIVSTRIPSSRIPMKVTVVPRTTRKACADVHGPVNDACLDKYYIGSGILRVGGRDDALRGGLGTESSGINSKIIGWVKEMYLSSQPGGQAHDTAQHKYHYARKL